MRVIYFPCYHKKICGYRERVSRRGTVTILGRVSLLGKRIQERRRAISASVHLTREGLAGTSFTRILHPLKFRLSAEDYAKYYFAGGPGAREWRKYKWRPRGGKGRGEPLTRFDIRDGRWRALRSTLRVSEQGGGGEHRARLSTCMRAIAYTTTDFPTRLRGLTYTPSPNIAEYERVREWEIDR